MIRYAAISTDKGPSLYAAKCDTITLIVCAHRWVGRVPAYGSRYAHTYIWCDVYDVCVCASVQRVRVR